MEFRKLAQGHGFTSKAFFGAYFSSVPRKTYTRRKFLGRRILGPNSWSRFFFNPHVHCCTSSLQYVTTPSLVDRDTAEVVGLKPLCPVHLSRAINVEKQETSPGSFHQQKTLWIQDCLSYQFVADYSQEMKKWCDIIKKSLSNRITE